MRFEYYEAAFNAGWFWRIRGRNGKVIADGAEGYGRQADVLKAIDRLNAKFIVPLKVAKRG